MGRTKSKQQAGRQAVTDTLREEEERVRRSKGAAAAAASDGPGLHVWHGVGAAANRDTQRAHLRVAEDEKRKVVTELNERAHQVDKLKAKFEVLAKSGISKVGRDGRKKPHTDSQTGCHQAARSSDEDGRAGVGRPGPELLLLLAGCVVLAGWLVVQIGEDGKEQSQAYFIIKAAQRREELQVGDRQADRQTEDQPASPTAQA